MAASPPILPVPLVIRIPVMAGSRASDTLVVSLEDRDTLGLWIRMPTAAQRLVLRSRIVLMLAEGLSAREVSRRLGVSRHTVDLWRARYLREGSDTLTRDRPGRGRKPAACAGVPRAGREHQSVCARPFVTPEPDSSI